MRDRLRHRDISELFVQVPRGEDFTSSLSALSKLAVDLRVPSAFLFRGYAGANTDSWIDPLKPNEQTIVNLDLCCFGSRTFSPCILVFQGCSREWLGNFAFEHNLRCHGFCSFRPGHKHLETGLASRVKKRDLPLRFQRSRFCPDDGRMISTLPAHPWLTASP